VGEFIDPDGKFREKLQKNPKKVVIKFGVDPTRPDIHLGHAVVLRKLRQFQDLGCKIIFLIGDFTAQIGDPTGKSKIRPEITYKEVENNMKTYLEQIKFILRQEEDVFAWINNLDWFISITDLVFDPQKEVKIIGKDGQSVSVLANTFAGKAQEYDNIQRQKLFNANIMNITVRTFLATLRHITYSRLIERDMFQERIKKGEELYLPEMMYPVLQGIDSFVLANVFGSCDLEVGGTDQYFNMLMGRDIMKVNGQNPQAVLSFKLLEGTDGTEKMSKSLDNYVGITDLPNEMYGKIMSIPDSSIVNYFELCTFSPMDEVEKTKKQLEQGKINPKDIKMNLAKQIVEIYHGKDKAKIAEESFVKTFQKGEIPENVEEINGEGLLAQILLQNKIFDSNSEIRRLFEAGAIKDMTEDKKLTVTDAVVKEHVYKIGKHRFIKIK
jgi:tyrosyl-tRNA synthetase